MDINSPFKKKLSYNWKRFRKSVAGKPNPVEYEQKRDLLKKLLLVEQHGLIDLYFTDESGFSLTPSIPYGWQPTGKQRTIRSSSAKVLNIFGLLSNQGKLITYARKENTNSDYVIACINDLCSKITRLTVLVLDNASWHTSEKIQGMLQQWAEKDLYLIFLPPYSPHLNLIETLWRKMKREWLKPEDYESAATLKKAIFTIIKNYDHDYTIDFSEEYLHADLKDAFI